MNIDAAIAYLKERAHTVKEVSKNRYQLLYKTGSGIKTTIMPRGLLIQYANWLKAKQ